MRPPSALWATRWPSRQQGAILLLMLILGIGGAVFSLLAQGSFSAHWRSRQQRADAAALAQARNALLGHAISYGERHPGQDHGYLPCPDRGLSGSISLGACASRDLPAAGRLPWRSLALPTPTAGSQHCLWYVVAGSAKHNPKPLRLNWDSPGQLRVLDTEGRALPIAAADGMAVALVIAPGPALAGQQRRHAPPCDGDSDAARAWADFIDSRLSSAGDGSWTLLHGQRGDAQYNDLISWLSVDDIFAALRRRRDFAEHLNSIIDAAAQSLAEQLDDEDFVTLHSQPGVNAQLRHGTLPTAATLAMTTAQAVLHDNWRDQFRFALCAAQDRCITVERSGGSEQCRAVLLFGGERISSGPARQQRLSAAERADPRQYFEADNADNLLAGIPRFSGEARFVVHDAQHPASEDVILCLP